MCNNGSCVSISGILFGCFCVGTRMPWHAYGGQTAYRDWFPPSTMWILGICLCSSAFTYRIILLGLCLFWGVQLCVCKHLGVKGKLGVHSFHHVGSRNGMSIRFSTCTIILYSTSPSPLCVFFLFLGRGLRLTVSPKLTSNWAVLVPWSPRHWNSYLWATMPIANYYYFVIWKDGLLLEEQSFLLQELRSLTLLCFFRYLAVPSRFPGNGIPRRRRWIFWPWWLLGSRHGSGKMCLTLQHSTQGAYPWWNPNRSLPYNWNISRT